MAFTDSSVQTPFSYLFKKNTHNQKINIQFQFKSPQIQPEEAEEETIPETQIQPMAVDRQTHWIIRHSFTHQYQSTHKSSFNINMVKYNPFPSIKMIEINGSIQYK